MTEIKNKSGNSLLKKIITAIVIILLAGTAVVWYLFTETFSDTLTTKADYEVKAKDLIREFQQNEPAANKKYTEKIIAVNGVVTAVEPSDTVVNIKMADPLSGSYIIFAFQQQHVSEAKKIKEGDSIIIKGSCSGGTYSHILETEFISFKRSTISQ